MAAFLEADLSEAITEPPRKRLRLQLPFDRRVLFSLPSELQDVSDLAHHLRARVLTPFSSTQCQDPLQDSQSAVALSIGGFYLLGKQSLAGVLRDDDIITVEDKCQQVHGAVALPAMGSLAASCGREANGMNGSAIAVQVHRPPAGERCRSPSSSSSSSSALPAKTGAPGVPALAAPAPAKAKAKANTAGRSQNLSKSKGKSSKKDVPPTPGAQQQDDSMSSMDAWQAARDEVMQLAQQKKEALLLSQQQRQRQQHPAPQTTAGLTMTDEKSEQEDEDDEESSDERTTKPNAPAAGGILANASIRVSTKPVAAAELASEMPKENGLLTNGVMEDATEEHKVFVGGLPFSCSEEILRRDFSECGEITNLRLLTEKETGRSRGMAFITFSTKAGLEAALKFNGDDYGGRALTVALASGQDRSVGVATGKKGSKGKGGGKGKDKGGKKGKGPKVRPEGCNSVVLKGVSYEATEDELQSLFQGCGQGPTGVRILTDRETGRPRGTVFLDFDPEDAEGMDAAVKMDGAELRGRWFRTDYAQPRAA